MQSKLVLLVLLLVLLLASIIQDAVCVRKRRTIEDDDDDDVPFEVTCLMNGQDCSTVSDIFTTQINTESFLLDQRRYSPIDNDHEGNGNDQRSKKFEKLAFVTPWNQKGYNYSLTHRRFTYMSPVWFELKIENGKVEVSGRQDIDEDWLDKITESKAEVSSDSSLSSSSSSYSSTYIFPRVKVALDEPLKPEELAIAARLLLELKDEFAFDGFVFEAFQSKDMGLLLAKTLREKSVMLIYVLPAIDPLEQAKKDQRTKYSNILAYVDSVSYRVLLMAYDYQNYEQKIPHSNAPKGWVTKIISGYKEVYPKMIPKLLVGAPLYGWKGSKAMLSRDIITWLNNDPDPESRSIEWSEGNQEHRIEANNEVCVFPTPSFILHRKELLKRLGVAGISYWELGQTNLATLSVC